MKAAITKQLNALKPEQNVMLKLTIPDKDDLYTDLIKHKNVLRVVALSGGYSREEANKRLARNHDMTASFSRALSEGLKAQQSDAEFQRGARRLDRKHLQGLDHLGKREQRLARFG